MGLKQFFRNITQLGRSDAAEERGTSVFSLLNNALGNFFFNNGDVTCNVSGKNAMRVSTVFTCVLVRGESLASLPVSVKQTTENGSRVAYEHPAHRLIHDKPNPFQTASDFWKTVSAHIDLYGNCFAIVKYSGSFRPRRIDIVCDPNAVQILESESGEAYFEYNGKRYAEYEMLHFKDLSLDGYYGCSRIAFNRDTIGYMSTLRDFGKNAIGKKPNGYFTTEANHDTVKKQEDAFTTKWNETIASGRAPLIPFGIKYIPLSITPGDAQYLDAVDATKEDIYGIFRVPPTLAQNYERATFSNAEQQDLVFVKYTMLPLITNIEQELNAKLFSEANATSKTPYYVKFNVNAFMRGDFKSRTEGYRTLWERGLITGNMVADLEDWDHYEGGDERFVPMNMIPLSKVNDFVDSLTAPIDSPAGNGGGSDNQQRGRFIFKNGKPHLNGHEN